MAGASDSERRLLAIYTGGTLGMQLEDSVLVSGKDLAVYLKTLPMFHDKDYAEAHSLPKDTLALPPTSSNQRIVYTVLEFQNLLDSSNMTIDDWIHIARTIESNYEQYHGFVVIHGTDTMAYGTSMLSFMLENLQKPVILTGSQVPIRKLWTDGRENLLGALLIAGQYDIPEVCLFFQSQLFRGNRVTKVDARRFEAFSSPNLPPLATVGTDVVVNWSLVRRTTRKGQLVVHSSMEQDVAVLRLYPGIPAALVRAFLQPPLKGVVMETFGTGNAPSKLELLKELRLATERGLVIVNCTSCLHGTVTSDYATGVALTVPGIISGYDMTSEAALAKLSFVLGHRDLSSDSRKELLLKDLRGEMTPPMVDKLWPSPCGSTLGHGVAWLFCLSSSLVPPKEAIAMRKALLPSLALAAAHAGDLQALQVLLDQDSGLILEGPNGQALLHTATQMGHTAVISMLLQRGVAANAPGKDGPSLLLLAVRARRPSVIQLLQKAGARLSPQEQEDVGSELCRLARSGDVEGLRAWQQAGADLGKPGYDGCRALSVAKDAGKLEVVAFLQSLESERPSEA